MATAATETESLVAFTLPGTPYSVRMARFYVKAALGYYDLGQFAGDAETVTSELVTNAITHAGARAVGLELTCLRGAGTLAIVVTDPSPLPPIVREPGGESEHWRGLRVVEALSVRWGWRPQGSGKAVFAILSREGLGDLLMNAERHQDWPAVGEAVRKRLAERKISIARLARESGLSETTIRYIGKSGERHYKSSLVAISAVLGWRHDYLTNILLGEPQRNARPKGPVEERLCRIESKLSVIVDKISETRHG